MGQRHYTKRGKPNIDKIIEDVLLLFSQKKINVQLIILVGGNAENMQHELSSRKRKPKIQSLSNKAGKGFSDFDIVVVTDPAYILDNDEEDICKSLNDNRNKMDSVAKKKRFIEIWWNPDSITSRSYAIQLYPEVDYYKYNYKSEKVNLRV